MVARREKWEEGIVEEFGVCKMHTKQGPTVLYMEFCSILCGSLDKRAVWGKRVSCICMAESLCHSPEIITSLLIDYTPI